MTEPAAGPRAAYEERAGRHAALRDAARSRVVRLSTLRVVTFLAAAAAGVAFDVLEGGAARAALAAAVTLVVVFLWEVAAHRRVRRTEAWHEALRGVAAEGLLRLDRDWAALADALPPAERAPAAVPPDHPYARDLDVTGGASLVRLLGPVTSERGRRTLLAWLLQGSEPTEVRARQEAVRELAGAVELRSQITAHGRLDAPAEPRELEPFLAWAKGDPWLLDSALLRWGAWIVPPIFLGLLVGDVFFGMPPWWLIPAAPQLEILRRTAPRQATEMRVAEEGGAPLRAYVPQLALLEAQEWSAEGLRALGERFGSGAGSASRKLARLSRLLDTVASRRNLFWAVGVPFLLLDVHLGVALDRWRRAHGRDVGAWLDALGEWEALAALATLAHDHPDWSFPAVAEEGPPVLRASAIGHPLIPPERCVRNDVEVGPPGSFLLVTGSNMSGKSTLLRALGTNVVLAGAGAPACATALSLPPLRLHTSMRIDDSLAEGISHFMAELLRVRGIVEAADGSGPPVDASQAGAGGGVAARGAAGTPVLYLLDEILHGTNTAERRVAARGVIRHLLASPAIGAVSTHDLTLADAPELRSASRPVHFREEVGAESGRTVLAFDYRLRPGVATTRNALKLLDAVGLGHVRLEEGEGEA